MARPIKSGLDYFPFDVDFFNDEKLIAVNGEFGLKGELTVVKLLCAIYRNGYFIEWSDMLKYKLIKELPGVTVNLLDMIIECLVKRKFFDKDLFDSAHILTSQGIQRRFRTICNKLHRKVDMTLYGLLPGQQASPEQQAFSAPQSDFVDCQPAPDPSDRPTSATSATSATQATPTKSHTRRPRKAKPLTLDQSIHLLAADAQWCSALCDRYAIKAADLPSVLDSFRAYCLAHDKTTHPDITDAKQHVCNLLDKSKLQAAPPGKQACQPADSGKQALRACATEQQAPDPEEQRFRRLVPVRGKNFLFSYAQYQALGLAELPDDRITEFCDQVISGRRKVPSIAQLVAPSVE